jgi:hypothetical protein
MPSPPAPPAAPAPGPLAHHASICDAGGRPCPPSAPAVAASEAAAGRSIRLGPCTTRAHQGATALGRTDRQTGPPAVASRQLHCCREYLPIVTAGTELWSFAELTEWTAGLSTLSGCKLVRDAFGHSSREPFPIVSPDADLCPAGNRGPVPDRISWRTLCLLRCLVRSRPRMDSKDGPLSQGSPALQNRGLSGRTSVVPQCFVFVAQS